MSQKYLEKVVPKVVTDGRFVTREGIVQANVSGYRDDTRAVLDREVAPHFRDAATKKQIHDSYKLPLLSALEGLTAVKGQPPKSLGLECDALAVDAEGRLIALEIKPGSVGTLAWVAAQATMYSRMLQHWVDNDPGWQSTVTKVFEQRAALGLVSSDFVLPALQQRVVPAVAFQRIASPEYIKRMHAVQDALLEAGVGDPDLRFYAVAPSGRLDPHQRP